MCSFTPPLQAAQVCHWIIFTRKAMVERCWAPHVRTLTPDMSCVLDYGLVISVATPSEVQSIRRDPVSMRVLNPVPSPDRCHGPGL